MTDLGDARARLLLHFRLRYGVQSLDEVRSTKVPGYWERVAPCGGLRGGCREPVHGFLFNEGPIRHTMNYFDLPRDERGRWASRTRTWHILSTRTPWPSDVSNTTPVGSP